MYIVRGWFSSDPMTTNKIIIAEFSNINIKYIVHHEEIQTDKPLKRDYVATLLFDEDAGLPSMFYVSSFLDKRPTARKPKENKQTVKAKPKKVTKTDAK